MEEDRRMIEAQVSYVVREGIHVLGDFRRVHGERTVHRVRAHCYEQEEGGRWKKRVCSPRKGKLLR